jgi:hypothetical protein
VTGNVSAAGPDRDGRRAVDRASGVVAGGTVSDDGAEETPDSGTSRTLAGDGLIGYVALGLGVLCLAALVLLDGVYAEQLTAIGILLYALALLVFYEQLGSAPTTPAPSAVAEYPGTGASSGGSGGPEVTDTVSSRADVTAESEATDGDESGAPPERRETLPDDRSVRDRRPATPNTLRWNEVGERMPAWGWSRAEHAGSPRNDVLDHGRPGNDERTPDDLQDGDAGTDDTDEPDDAGPNEASIRSEFACEYCGRDGFESAAQRNGHLGWCDEYDPNASPADDGAETTEATGSGEAAEADEWGTVGSADDAGTSRTGVTRETGATAETTSDVETADAEGEIGGAGTPNGSTTVESDAAEETDERDTGDTGETTRTEGATETGAASTVNGAASTVNGPTSTMNGRADDRGDGAATAPNTPPESGRPPQEPVTSSARTSGEQPIVLPASTVSSARRHLRAGRLDEAVNSAYREVRAELSVRNDLPTHRTHREFSAACRETFGDDDSVEALQRLVSIYEQLYYADDVDADRAEIEALLDRLVDTGSARS